MVKTDSYLLTQIFVEWNQYFTRIVCVFASGVAKCPVK